MASYFSLRKCYDYNALFCILFYYLFFIVFLCFVGVLGIFNHVEQKAVKKHINPSRNVRRFLCFFLSFFCHLLETKHEELTISNNGNNNNKKGYTTIPNSFDCLEVFSAKGDQTHTHEPHPSPSHPWPLNRVAGVRKAATLATLN